MDYARELSNQFLGITDHLPFNLLFPFSVLFDEGNQFLVLKQALNTDQISSQAQNKAKIQNDPPKGDQTQLKLIGANL